MDYQEAYYRYEDNKLIGVLVLTDYRLIFRFKDSDVLQRLNLSQEFFKIPYFQINK